MPRRLSCSSIIFGVVVLFAIVPFHVAYLDYNEMYHRGVKLLKLAVGDDTKQSIRSIEAESRIVQTPIILQTDPIHPHVKRWTRTVPRAVRHKPPSINYNERLPEPLADRTNNYEEEDARRESRSRNIVETWLQTSPLSQASGGVAESSPSKSVELQIRNAGRKTEDNENHGNGCERESNAGTLHASEKVNISGCTSNLFGRAKKGSSNHTTVHTAEEQLKNAVRKTEDKENRGNGCERESNAGTLHASEKVNISGCTSNLFGRAKKGSSNHTTVHTAEEQLKNAGRKTEDKENRGNGCERESNAGTLHASEKVNISGCTSNLFGRAKKGSSNHTTVHTAEEQLKITLDAAAEARKKAQIQVPSGARHMDHNGSEESSGPSVEGSSWRPGESDMSDLSDDDWSAPDAGGSAVPTPVAVPTPRMSKEPAIIAKSKIQTIVFSASVSSPATASAPTATPPRSKQTAVVPKSAPGKMQSTSKNTQPQTYKKQWTVKDKAKYRNPKRPCPFCNTMQAKLARHIKRKHKEKIPKNTEVEKEVFRKFRMAGIDLENRKRAVLGDHQICQRRVGSVAIEMFVICSGCRGKFKKSSMPKHKRNCITSTITKGLSLVNDQIPITNILGRIPHRDKHLENEWKIFQQKVCPTFRDTAVGNLCRKDQTIQLVGFRKYVQEFKKNEIANTTELMRNMARLVIQFQTLTEQDTVTVEDMLVRANMPEICAALRETAGHDKPDNKKKLGYTVKTFVKEMEMHCLSQEEDRKAEEMAKFRKAFDENFSFLMGSSSKGVLINRAKRLRLPASMPDKQDMHKVMEFIGAAVTAAQSDFCQGQRLQTSEFNRLRAVVVVRLSIYNASRGNEPAQLTLEEFEEGVEGKWLGDAEKFAKDDLEQKLMKNTVLCMQVNKGAKTLIPLLIPKDILSPIQLLIESRAVAGIEPANIYVFASSHGSEKHCRGSDMMSEVAKLANVSNKKSMNATNIRHEISTTVAGIDCTPAERAAWLMLVGHSERISQNTYQCPQAYMFAGRINKALYVQEQAFKDSASVPKNVSLDALAESYAAPPREVMNGPTTANNKLQDSQATSSKSLCMSSHSPSVRNSPIIQLPAAKCQVEKPKKAKAQVHVKWQPGDNALVQSEFRSNIESGKLPGKKDLEAFLDAHAMDVTIQRLKNKIWNEIQRYRTSPNHRNSAASQDPQPIIDFELC